MFGDKKEIHSGDYNTNIQGNSVTVYSGISYMDAREIALQTFKDNFHQLSEVANNTAMERAELLVNQFLGKLQAESPEFIGKLVEPDLQYAVINAQTQFARTGRPESLKLLSELLKNRFQNSEISLKKIVLNEAIDTVSKLTEDQLKIITLIFLAKNCKVPDSIYLLHMMVLFTDSIDKYHNDASYFEHLVYVGVAAHDRSTKNGQKLEYLISQNYANEFSEILKNPAHEVNRLIRENYKSFPLSDKIFEVWNNSFAMLFSLTSVGEALAINYYNSTYDANLDLEIWIKN